MLSVRLNVIIWGSFIIYVRVWASKNKGGERGGGGGGVTTNLGQCEGGHEEIDIQQGGCLILQFCFIFKEMR